MNIAIDNIELAREARRQKRAANGVPIKRRLPMVGRRKADNPWGLTEQQALVVDALYRLGEVRYVAAELGMKRSTVSQRLTWACRQAKVKNAVLLVVEWAKWKWEQERAPRVWSGLGGTT